MKKIIYANQYKFSLFLVLSIFPSYRDAVKTVVFGYIYSEIVITQCEISDWYLSIQVMHTNFGLNDEECLG